MDTARDRIEVKLGLNGPPLQPLRGSPPNIPDHELIRRIGQGAYGEVWLARNALGTWRAAKIVYRDNFRDARPYERELAGIRRFEPLSRSNEGFVDILQIGRNDQEGWFYYIMELADSAEHPRLEAANSNEKDPAVTAGYNVLLGLKSDLTTADLDSYEPRTLARDLHQRGRLPLEDCLQLGLTLTLALGQLHRHGLIHRDVKPSNIIFVGGVPKLADIGLVTEAQSANTFVGTEGFVPPEGPTSPQADLYALGKVLYEAAMGKDRNEFPEPYSQICADDESIALMELNAVLLRACAPDPSARYRSAEEMHADLALLHSGGSVKRRHQLERHFRLAQRAGALALVLLVLASAAWLWQERQTGKMAELAKANAALATERAALADHLTRIGETNRESLVHLSIANGLRILDEGDPAAALLWFANALPLMTNHPAEEAIHRIRIQQALDRTPKIRRIFPHESGLSATAFSPDGRLIATITKEGNVRVWNALDGTLKWGPKPLGLTGSFIRFTRDGRHLLISSCTDQGTFNGSLPPIMTFGICDAETGNENSLGEEAFPGLAVPGMMGVYYSPDDRWVAVPHSNNVIRVFSLHHGHHVAELRGHEKEVLCVAFNSNGTLLASASADHTVRLWRLPDGVAAGEPLEHSWPVVRVQFAPDGQTLVAATFENVGDDGGAEIHVWDLSSRQRLPAKLEARDRIAVFAAPGEQGALFLQDRPPNPIRAYNLHDLEPVRFKLNFGGVMSWDFTQDGTQMALGLGDHIARVFDSRSGVPLTPSFRHGRWGVRSVKFSPTDPLLLTGCEDGNARLWDLQHLPSETLRRQLPHGLAPRGTMRYLGEFGRSEGVFAVHGEFGGAGVGVFNEGLEEIYQISPDTTDSQIVGPSVSPDGRFWAIRVFPGLSQISNELRLGRVENDRIRQVQLSEGAGVYDCTFTPDSRQLLAVFGDRRIKFWNTSDARLEKSVTLPSDAPGEFLFIGPDGRTGLWQEQSTSGSPHYIIRFVELNSGEFIGAPIKAAPTVFDWVFSPDGKFLAVMDEPCSVTLWESRTGRPISTVRHPGKLTRMQWDFASRRFVTVGENDEAIVWDALTGESLLSPLRTPGSIVSGARWSPDGRFIVTASRDNAVRVWDAIRGDLVTGALGSLEPGDVLSNAFITRSNRVISVSYSSAGLRAWDLRETSLSPELLLDYAKYLSGRRLTPSGDQLALTPEELSTLDRSLRQRAPELFH